jgi:hypothetical protein
MLFSRRLEVFLILVMTIPVEAVALARRPSMIRAMVYSSEILASEPLGIGVAAYSQHTFHDLITNPRNAFPCFFLAQNLSAPQCRVA